MLKKCLTPALLCSAERRTGVTSFTPVEMQVKQAEVDAGLQAHPHVPSFLREWLAKEAVQTAAAV